MTKKKNELAIVEDISKLPAGLMDVRKAKAGQGFENWTADDVILPSLKRAESMR